MRTRMAELVAQNAMLEEKLQDSEARKAHLSRNKVLFLSFACPLYFSVWTWVCADECMCLCPVGCGSNLVRDQAEIVIV